MKELLDKFDRDRWVEVLKDLPTDTKEQEETLQEVINYLSNKEVK